MSRGVTRRALSSSLLLLALLGIASGAVAVWTSGGTGAGSGTTGTALDVTITSATPTADLFPGGQADVELTMTNPNTFAVLVESLFLDADRGTNGFAVDAAHAGCTLSALGYAPQTTGWTVPASGSLSVTLTDALSMDASAASACQGATFTVYVQAGA